MGYFTPEGASKATCNEYARGDIKTLWGRNSDGRHLTAYSLLQNRSLHNIMAL